MDGYEGMDVEMWDEERWNGRLETGIGMVVMFL